MTTGKYYQSQYGTKRIHGNSRYFYIFKKDIMKKLLEQPLYSYLIIAICARICLFGASIGDALAFLGITGIIAYNIYLKDKNENKTHISSDMQMQKELKEMKDIMSTVGMKGIRPEPKNLRMF
jgi:hypothetical protein